jgi:serine/threonine protein kinase
MRGQVFPASDLYSLGVTCIRLLTAYLPNADGYDELYDAINGVWRWRERLPNSINISLNLGQILDNLLQDYVNERYQSVEDVLQVLNPITLQQNPLQPARKVDYTKLHDLLMKNKWREADQETLAIMLKVSRREKQGWLDVEDIKKFPIEELSTIDDLWNTHSNGKFGFKSQTQIWLSIQGKLQTDYQIWCSFGNSVGWCQRYSWKGYDNLTFSFESPKGHLPSGIFMLFQGFGNWDLRLSSLAAGLLAPSNHQSVALHGSYCQASSFPCHLNSVEAKDYSKLNNLLKSSRWQDANEETFDMLLKIADREKQGSLYVNDIKELSCQDLRIIDSLWTEYSNGKFGLSIQKQIWLNIRGQKEPDSEDWCRFAYEVGWLKAKIGRKALTFFADFFFEETPVWFDELSFSIKAPKGHLPCFKSIGMTSSVVDLILLRCDECGL